MKQERSSFEQDVRGRMYGIWGELSERRSLC